MCGFVVHGSRFKEFKEFKSNFYFSPLTSLTFVTTRQFKQAWLLSLLQKFTLSLFIPHSSFLIRHSSLLSVPQTLIIPCFWHFSPLRLKNAKIFCSFPESFHNFALDSWSFVPLLAAWMYSQGQNVKTAYAERKVVMPVMVKPAEAGVPGQLGWVGIWVRHT